MLISLNRATFKKQSGISLLEVMLSLSIIAIILVMATRYFFVASNNSNVNKLRGQIGTVVSALQEYRNQHPNYVALTGMDTLIAQGFIAQTADVDVGAGTLSNPWTNPITLTPGGNPVGTNVMISTDLPTEANCRALMGGYSAEQLVACNPAAGGTGFTFSLTIGL